VAAQSPLKITRAEEIQTAQGYNFPGTQMNHETHQTSSKATQLPHRLAPPPRVFCAKSAEVEEIIGESILRDAKEFVRV
jgi:hypothetical protein